MTYQSPGRSRSSFFSATAGSSSSSSAAAGAASAATSASAAASGATAAWAASASSLSGSTVASASVSTLVSSMMTSTLSAEGVSPSKEVTCQSSLIRSSAEHQQHELGQAKVDQADQRHHEGQENQHHGGVVDHLLAVRPDHLAQLGDNLQQEVPDEGERVSRRPIAGLLGCLGFTAGAVLGRGGLGSLSKIDGFAFGIDCAAPRPLACRTRRAGHHR